MAMQDFNTTLSEQMFSQSFEEDLEDSDTTAYEYEGDSACTTWIEWFCSIEGHEYFVPVDEDYISDDFNLKGLYEQVPHFKEACYMILNLDYDGSSHDSEEIEKCAGTLYGLVHARFILTPKGMQLMHSKYDTKEFGKCPNANCNDMAVLPIGLHDQLCKQSAKIFCPRCNEVLHPPEQSGLSLLDGAVFGKSFPHLFFLQYPLQVTHSLYYTPKIFGFRVNADIKDAMRKQKATLADAERNGSTEAGRGALR